jgi:hypothetical protein
MAALIDLVRQSLSEETIPVYMDRVENQAATLRESIRAGELDNDDFAVGLEMEVYAVERDGESRLAGLPQSVFDAGATKELGVHNAEINTDPDVFDEDGLCSQADRIEEAFEAADDAAQQSDRLLISDAMWTIAPEEGADSYLSDVEIENGVTVATNMRTDPRYAAIDNDVLRAFGGEIGLDVPGVDRGFPSILFESLATSIQPHLQIPTAAEFPAYYNAAIRTLGPLLALTTNSPFLPPELYTDVDDPHDLVDRTDHELRIAVFEQSVNATPSPKVCVPDDIDSAEETIDRVVEDDLYAPFLREWIVDESRDSFAADTWEFQYKRSTYWRWLRCVVGGDAVDGAGDEESLRIEYRPIPTQPTVTDVVAVQWLTVGLLRGLVETGHPLPDLPWAEAEQSFYNAARDGLDADLAWITSDGERTTDSGVIFEEVFELARTGLRDAGVSTAKIDSYLDAPETRWTENTTPSIWKQSRVRDRLDDGDDLATAITAAQESYIQHSREYDSFAEWL